MGGFSIGIFVNSLFFSHNGMSVSIIIDFIPNTWENIFRIYINWRESYSNQEFHIFRDCST